MKDRNCEIGGCEDKSKIVCPTCKHWIPNRKHKYYRCSRFLTSRITCPLPKYRCKTCEFYITPKAGRPENDYTEQNKSKENRKEYMKDYMKDYRTKKSKRNKKPKVEDSAVIDPEHQKFIDDQIAALPKIEHAPIVNLTIKGKSIDK